MAKKKSVDEMSRPERRGPPGPSPLLIIAGLPESTAASAAATINNNGASRWLAVAGAFQAKDAGLYADEAATLDLARHACSIAFDSETDKFGVPKPSRVALAYAEAEGAEHLWEVFGYAVWPISLQHPDWTWPKGRHWRHEIETVNQLIKLALANLEKGEAEQTRLRLEARRNDDILLLPGRNFHFDRDKRIAERFEAFMSNDLSLDGIEQGIHVERFAYERLEAFYSRMGGRNKSYAVDDRAIVFAKGSHGQDGGHHPTDGDVELDATVIRRNLEGRYRFGTPLEPAGFQHDAQFERGKVFARERFDCIIKGPIDVSGSHANVFPNDVVTGDFLLPDK